MESSGENSRPKVSWLLPVKDGMPYLREALESIRLQSFQGAEVLVWDNGSTDGTLEELQRWIPSILPGRIITNRPLPLGICLAELTREATTEFCARMDADDINLPERLTRQIEFLVEHPDVAAVGSQIDHMDASGKDLNQSSGYPLDHDGIVEMMLLRNPLAHPAVVFRRSAVLAVGNYHDFSPTHVEDYDLWLRMAAAGRRLANVPETLLRYRIHEKSSTLKSLSANRLHNEMLNRLSDAAPDLYGCSGETIRQLRGQGHPHAILPLRQIARRIGTGGNPWKSPIFYRAAREMIAARDLRSRLSAAMENRGMIGGLSELQAISVDLARNLTRRLRRVG